jgi:protein-tyrosine phosphatase
VPKLCRARWVDNVRVRTELHFHLLPGVDDGPRNDRESVELAHLAVADGTQRIVCTPHAREFRLMELPSRVDALRELLAAERIALDVLPGGEISPRDAAGMRPEELHLIAQGPDGARWLLLEVPLWPGDRTFVPATETLRDQGYELVIGHPERGSGISFDVLEDQVRRGAILQINASSLVGRHGPESERRGLAIAHSGLPFVLASDAHSPARPPSITEAARRLAASGLEPEVISAAVEIGPARLLELGLPFGEATREDLGLRSPKRAA